MKLPFFYIILLVLILSCEDSEIFETGPDIGSRTLKINWIRDEECENSDHSNAMIYLYDNEDDYLDSLGKPVYSQSLSDSMSVTIKDTALSKYWVRLLNYSSDYYFEHKNDISFYIDYPVVKNTLSTFTFNVKTNYSIIYSFQINKIEIYNLLSYAEIGDEIEIIIIQTSGIDDNVINRRIRIKKTVTDNNITITSRSMMSFLLESKYRYYIYIDDVKYCELDMLAIFGNLIQERKIISWDNLINQEYIKLNSNNEIEYKLDVTWRFEDE